jgi:hypothetical protein
MEQFCWKNLHRRLVHNLVRYRRNIGLNVISVSAFVSGKKNKREVVIKGVNIEKNKWNVRMANGPKKNFCCQFSIYVLPLKSVLTENFCAKEFMLPIIPF